MVPRERGRQVSERSFIPRSEELRDVARSPRLLSRYVPLWWGRLTRPLMNFVGLTERRMARRLRDPDQLAVFLRVLPSILERHGTDWNYIDPEDKLGERSVGFGYGTQHFNRVRNIGTMDEPVRIVELVEQPNWVIAWGSKWQYRIVPEGREIVSRRAALREKGAEK